MPGIKLDRLPNRTPVKMTITVSPELNDALKDYAEIYRRSYGQNESVAELIPFMLDAFIDADAGFRKARKALAASGPASPSPQAKE
jgi:hypothetical protein